MGGVTYLHKRGVYGASVCNVRSNVSLRLLEKFSMGDPGTLWLISPLLHQLETSIFFQFVLQRSYSVMVALTQKSFSPQYGWFCRGRSHIGVLSTLLLLVRITQQIQKVWKAHLSEEHTNLVCCTH